MQRMRAMYSKTPFMRYGSTETVEVEKAGKLCRDFVYQKLCEEMNYTSSCLYVS